MSLSKLMQSNTDLHYPTVKPKLDLNFTGKSLGIDPAYTFTRNSSVASYVDADGFIKYAGINQPRFDHDPLTGECKGLLIEEQRTNLTRYSSRFDDWAAATGGVTVERDVAIAPDGTKTATLLTFDPATSDFGQCRFLRTASWGSAFVPYTFSVFVKKGTLPSVNVWTSVVRDPYPRVTYIFDTDSIILGGGTYKISKVKYRDGWVRLIGTAMSSLSGDVVGFNIFSSGTLYAWGFQLELGDFATSYIPTLGSTVTRSPDQLTLNNAPIDLNGTFYFDSSFELEENPTTSLYSNNSYPLRYTSRKTIFSADNGTKSVSLRENSNQLYQSTTEEVSQSYGKLENRSAKRIITFSEQQNNVLSSSNTEQSIGISSPDVNSIIGLNRLSIGHDSLNPGRQLNGTIKKFSYYSKDLSPTTSNSLISASKPVIYYTPSIIGGDDVFEINIGGIRYMVHKFLGTGTQSFKLTRDLDIEYLIVAGGGGGGAYGGSFATGGGGGGGGAGGLLTNVGGSLLSLAKNTYTITIGSGGNGGNSTARGSNGSNSTAFGFTTIGGGGGGGSANKSGLSGGSGGGVAQEGGGLSAATGTVSQGNDGGTTTTTGSTDSAAGGGGAGAVGENGSSGGKAGNGGIGVISTITGESIYYAGGGGGGHASLSSGTGGLGGGANGGNASYINIKAPSGRDGFGGGGGGAMSNEFGVSAGGNGGSGVIIVRYRI